MGHTHVVAITLLAAALPAPARAGGPAALAGRSALDPVVLALRNTDGGQSRLHAWTAGRPLQQGQGVRGELVSQDVSPGSGIVSIRPLERP